MKTTHPSTPFSLIIVVQGDEANLEPLFTGISQSTIVPDEIIVVHMCDNSRPTSYKSLPIKEYEVHGRPRCKASFSAARNLGAEKASHEKLIYLDSTCVPSRSCIGNLLATGCELGGLVMGRTRFLLADITTSHGFENMMANSVLHPYSPVVVDRLVTSDVSPFMPYFFFVDKALFFEVGGFDEEYSGYGAEDTDFALRLQQRGHYLTLVNCDVFHQQHPVYSPPLDRFAEIVRNSRKFYRRWKYWPLERWLKRFVEIGLITWSPAARNIEILKQPSQNLVDAALRPNAPFAL